MLRKFFSLILSFVIMSFVFLLCNKVEASGSVLDLHTKTKIYSSNDEDYYDGCEDFNDYDESLPTITVLNHGFGGQYFHWSNKYNVGGGGIFVYNSHSIVEKLYQHLNGNLSIYVAKANPDLIIDDATNPIESYKYNGYKLYKVSHFDYVSNADNEVQVDYLDDVSKHILILFNSQGLVTTSTHAIAYEEFHNVLDDISYQYKLLTGVLPRYNLIGHSRGGIINLMYATEHIYNVHSLYSIGTPYNGAVLGNIDPIMEAFGYYITDSAGNTVLNANYAGVGDIMSDQGNINIRNAWNAVYTPDMGIKVYAFGSMTSIDFMRELVDEIVSETDYPYAFANLITEYQFLLNTIINVVDYNAENLYAASQNALEFVNGVALVNQAFGVDLFDSFFTNVDSSLEGDITTEEVYEILSLFNVFPIEEEESNTIVPTAVIMDDLFIDTDSQLGRGFADGITYEGFETYVKIFDEMDVSRNCAMTSLPPVPHNLETMDDDYIQTILSLIELGTPSQNIITLEDDSSNTYYFSDKIVFKLFNNYRGERTIAAEGCTIDIYYYDNGYLKRAKESSSNTSTFEFMANVRYLIFISKTSPGYSVISSTFESMHILGETTSISDLCLVEPGKEQIIKIKVTYISDYLFTLSALSSFDVSLYNSEDTLVTANIVSINLDCNQHFSASLLRGTYYLKIKNPNQSNSTEVSFNVEKHTHIYSYTPSGNNHLGVCECGYEALFSHVYNTHICIDCGAGTSAHEFDRNYVWVDLTSHRASCECGAVSNLPHVISSGSTGGKFSTCLLCGGRVQTGFIQIQSLINKVSANGSYVLSNGIIVLVDEDLEAFFNGSLVFYDKNDESLIQ